MQLASLPQALLADLVLAGVAFELQETPLRWLSAAAEPPPSVPSARPEPIPAPEIPPAAAPSYQVWHTGVAGGVVVVVYAAAPLADLEVALLTQMLRAVGLQQAPLAYVGLAGLPAKSNLAQAKAEIIAAAQAFTPTHSLVLGQTALGVMLEKTQGVEGWQAAPAALGLPGRVGVTFPLDLLLHKPLFKGLAWQHLQAWVTA
jgi:hypothetical protein